MRGLKDLQQEVSGLREITERLGLFSQERMDGLEERLCALESLQHESSGEISSGDKSRRLAVYESKGLKEEVGLGFKEWISPEEVFRDVRNVLEIPSVQVAESMGISLDSLEAYEGGEEINSLGSYRHNYKRFLSEALDRAIRDGRYPFEYLNALRFIVSNVWTFTDRALLDTRNFDEL
jgi:hypothetical protein